MMLFSFQTFIVRKSSQANTMALSVRLPENLSSNKKGLPSKRLEEDKGIPVPLSAETHLDFVQHYLIEQHQDDASNKGKDNVKTDSNKKLPNKTESKLKTKMKLESSHNSFDNILSLVYHYLTVR